jgi:hypothetical protein
MHLVKISIVTDGPGPSEKVVGVPTTDGSEEVVLHASALMGDRIEVGVLGFAEDGKRALVELPRESVSGRWRVWVPAAMLHAT